jgi:3-methyladenine DNA glycosylase AlkC
MYTKQKKEIEEKFNQVKAQLYQANNTVRSLSEECLRLQGEFRLISQLEKDLKTNTKSNEQQTNA